MFFQHIYDKGLAQASYLIGCQATGEAIVIDPRRDVEVYLQAARKEKLKITNVTETHIHADFLSGAKELASVTGADLLLSDEGPADWQYQFEHKGLRHGDIISVGNLKLEVLFTPGHTPEHISFLLTDTKATNKPIMIFTGDFIFVGDVGRPDLLEKAAGIKGTRETGARDMFNSLKIFKSLPDYIQVWPGHGAGSACGKALGAVPSSTVGYEKLVNWALQIDNEDEFVEKLLEGQPEPPKYFATMKKLNKQGPAFAGLNYKPELLSSEDFISLKKQNITIIDTRHRKEFSEGHIPMSINIPDNNSFTTWAGWLLEYDKPFIITGHPDRFEHIYKSLLRIGLDNVSGFIDFNIASKISGDKLSKAISIDPATLSNNFDDYFVLDVRGYTEFAEGHIPGAEHIHTGHLIHHLNQLPVEKNIVLNCETGSRSAIAVSLLLSNGFTNVFNLEGGIKKWISSGFETKESKPVEKLSAEY